MNVRWAPGKAAQVVEMVNEIPGVRTIKGTGVRGWDQSAKKITGYWYTSHMGVWSGAWEKRGDTWFVESTGVNLDGAQCTGMMEVKVLDKDTLAVTERRQTIAGKPYPDDAYQLRRVGKKVQVTNYERLKELEFLVGDWEAKRDDGRITHWTFHWTEGKNGLQNVITGKAADGSIQYSNMGVFGWDSDNRRITNWFVTEKGKQGRGFWVKREDGKWDVWLAGSQSTWIGAVVDDNTWTMDGIDGVQVFKRVD